MLNINFTVHHSMRREYFVSGKAVDSSKTEFHYPTYSPWTGQCWTDFSFSSLILMSFVVKIRYSSFCCLFSPQLAWKHAEGLTIDCGWCGDGICDVILLAFSMVESCTCSGSNSSTTDGVVPLKSLKVIVSSRKKQYILIQPFRDVLFVWVPSSVSNSSFIFSSEHIL